MTSDWPQELRKERLYGNFRHRGRPAKKKNWRDKRPGMSEDHLALLRRMPCCITLRVGSDTQVHHLKQGTGERGMGVRSSDKWGLPVSPAIHDEIERLGSKNELAWFKSHGIDALDLATALWINTGDLGKMIKVLMAHRGK